MQRMLFNGGSVTFQVDTGSTVNLLPRKFADNSDHTMEKS